MQVMDGASRILEHSLSRGSCVIANYALVPFHDPGSAPAPRPGALAPCAHPPALRPGRTERLRGLHCGPAGAPSPHVRSAPRAGLADAASSPSPLPATRTLISPSPALPLRVVGVGDAEARTTFKKPRCEAVRLQQITFLPAIDREENHLPGSLRC